MSPVDDAIRVLQPADRSAWERLYAAYAAFYGEDLTPGRCETVWTCSARRA